MKTEYILQTCKSTVEFLDTESLIIQAISNFTDSTLVAFYEDQMLIDIQKGTNWERFKTFEHLVDLRIFNKDQELHVWLSNSKLKGRLRVDGDGMKTECFESIKLLNGTTFQSGADKTRIEVSEEKGTSYFLPYSDRFISIVGCKKDEKRLSVKTLNYIDYSETGQAGIIDSRFCELVIVEPEKFEL